MTEEEWLACAHPEPMLDFLRDKAPERKLRLFVCGCCRRTPSLMALPSGRATVEASELWADGLLPENEVRERAIESMAARHDPDFDIDLFPLLLALSTDNPIIAHRFLFHWLNRWSSEPVNRWCASSLRCLIGTPFPRPRGDRTARPQIGWLGAAAQGIVKLFASSPLRQIEDIPKTENIIPALAADPSWLTSDVLALARQMYESRDFSAMPILADALQDAGCDNADMLNHCREPGVHVRGCWVVDLVLGKE